MKTSVVYGVVLAVVSALLTLLLFFLGVHNDPEKLKSTRTILSLVSLAITVAVIVMALRAVRANSPDGGLTYGRGVLASCVVGLVGGAISAVFMLVYMKLINPDFLEANYQLAVAEAQARGASDTDVQNAEGIMRMFTGAGFITAMTLIGTPITCTVIGLIASIFVKRAPVATPPPPPAEAAV